MKKLTISKLLYCLILMLPLLFTIGQVLIGALNENSGIVLTTTYVLNTLNDNLTAIGITTMNPTRQVLTDMYTTFNVTDVTTLNIFSYLLNVTLIYAIINIPLVLMKVVIYNCDKMVEKMEK